MSEIQSVMSSSQQECRELRERVADVEDPLTTLTNNNTKVQYAPKKTSTKVPVRYGNGTVLNGTCRVAVRYFEGTFEGTIAVVRRYPSGTSKGSSLVVSGSASKVGYVS